MSHPDFRSRMCNGCEVTPAAGLTLQESRKTRFIACSWHRRRGSTAGRPRRIRAPQGFHGGYKEIDPFPGALFPGIAVHQEYRASILFLPVQSN